jgi:ABC-type uncharacterized transport system substrate-binding protein
LIYDRHSYIEGKNLVIDQRSAEGRLDRLPSFLSELIALRPDVIVAIATPAIAAAQSATSTIPIIMAPATDPIGSGFVKSLARPGGNITGMANMNSDSVGKVVELLHTLLPSANRIAVLLSDNPTHPLQYELAEVAIKNLGLSAVRVVAPRFSGPLRASVPILAGVLAMPSRWFQLANFSSALLWAAVLLKLGDVGAAISTWVWSDLLGKLWM